MRSTATADNELTKSPASDSVMASAAALVPVFGIGFALLGAPATTSLLAAVTLIIQSVFGIHVLRIILPRTDFSITGLLGPGMTVGSAIWVLTVQAIGSGAVSNFVAMGLMLSVSVCLSRDLRCHPHRHSMDELLTIVALALIIMSNEWRFMVVGGLIMLSAAQVSATEKLSGRTIHVVRIVLIGIAIFSLIRGQASHGEFWWIVTDDYSYYEALQFHLRETGIWESWGPTNIASYHWLAPAWVGQMTQIVWAPDWIVLTRITPLVFSMTIVATTLELLRELTRSTAKSRLQAPVLLGCLYLFLVLKIDFSGTSTYVVFAYAATTILIVIKGVLGKFSILRLFLALFLLAATLFAKLFSAPIVASLVALLASTRLTRHRSQSLVAISVAGISLTLTYLLFLVSFGGELGNGIEDAWNVHLFTVTDLFRLLAPSIGVMIVPFALGLLIIHSDPKVAGERLLIGAVGIVSLTIATITKLLVSPGFAINVDDYLIKPASYFALLIPALALRTAWLKDIFRPALTGVVGSVFFVSELPLVSQILSRIPGSVVNGLRLDHVLTHIWVAPLSFALLISGGLLAARRVSKIDTYLRCFLVSSLLSIACFEVANRLDIALNLDGARWAERESPTVVSVLGNSQLESVGRWLSVNTPKDSLIATNDLCDDSQRYSSSLFSTELWMCRSMGDDYTLGHTSKRRFLILGPRFAYQNPDLRDRYTSASLRFAEEPSILSKKELAALGVDYFVLKSESTEAHVQLEGIVQLFRAGDYSVLSLNQSQNSR